MNKKNLYLCATACVFSLAGTAWGSEYSQFIRVEQDSFGRKLDTPYDVLYKSIYDKDAKKIERLKWDKSLLQNRHFDMGGLDLRLNCQIEYDEKQEEEKLEEEQRKRLEKKFSKSLSTSGGGGRPPEEDMLFDFSPIPKIETLNIFKESLNFESSLSKIDFTLFSYEDENIKVKSISENFFTAEYKKIISDILIPIKLLKVSNLLNSPQYQALSNFPNFSSMPIQMPNFQIFPIVPAPVPLLITPGNGQTTSVNSNQNVKKKKKKSKTSSKKMGKD